MKINEVIWIIATVIVCTAIAMIVDAPTGHTQERSAGRSGSTPTVTNPSNSKFGVVDYYAVESQEASELERRKRASARYDNEGWVTRNPHPETAKVGRIGEAVPPPLIPVAESDLVVIGRITEVATRLSNDKTGIYSEFSVKVVDTIKNGTSDDVRLGIKTDRAGGIVRYPTGQTVLYEDGVQGVPEMGKEYVLFLKADPKNENYQIITLYELNETTTTPLDSGRNSDEIRRMGKARFVAAVRGELSRHEEKSSKREP